MDSILSRFNDSRTEEDSDPVKREKLSIESGTNPFFLKYEERKYDGQYFAMYQYRLKVLRERVTQSCEEKWDSHFELNNRRIVKKNKVLDIQANEPCWCVGTIYCEMRYKPNVLEEVVNDVYGAPDLVKSYTDAEGSDEIMLEDESGRVLLVGDIVQSKPFISGTVVGILGMEADAGAFQVLDICYPYALPQSKLPQNPTAGKIALVSGLNINTENPKLSLKLQLLQEYLTGDLIDIDSVSKINRLIVCGNSINPTEATALGGCLKELGTFLGNTLQSMPIDLMPGANDLSDQSLPQQPLHKALFEGTIKPFFKDIENELFSPTTNPVWFKFNGIEMLGTSGQNIDDICKYIIPNLSTSEPDSSGEGDMNVRLNMMEGCLKWQNIAPTAPDTLWCYPYKSDDPFILNKLPHVYFVGNQPAYMSRDVKLEGGLNVKIMTIPKFSETGEIVILDLKTLEAEVVTIQV
ncbi:LANO_0E15192g1_1 [Lachancea nothofagi CBS 11611]|uniref:DNA-directed DNA polymerase n=1 Tax=Lachancea nothofagi CBS 11611 TaxID=1266666 RepID=A0A1G4K0S9_9SACH|nr:LANO_0E15192g1_1 [Lachancea nothofagi CBS 11611]